MNFVIYLMMASSLSAATPDVAQLEPLPPGTLIGVSSDYHSRFGEIVRKSGGKCAGVVSVRRYPVSGAFLVYCGGFVQYKVYENGTKYSVKAHID